MIYEDERYIFLGEYFRLLREKTEREALFFPNIRRLINVLKDVQRVVIVGEPSYLCVFLCCLIKKYVLPSLRIEVRFAQNCINRLPIGFASIERWTVKYIDHVYYVAPPSKQAFIDKFPKYNGDLTLIPNPIKEDFFQDYS